MNYGFIVHNSIDGSLGFSVGLFTFRHACSNMVWLGAGQEQSGMSFDGRNVISSYYHRHTEGLETDGDELKELIENTVDLIPEIHDTYEEWAQTSGVRVDKIRELRDRLPHSDLPEWVQDAIDVLNEKRKSLDEDEKLTGKDEESEFLNQMPSGESEWSFYNDVTENIWHSDTTNDRSKKQKNQQLHRVMSVS